jgi:NAD(P)-dependent dehydrogenase (short-subunit alcohol dehydrogenase family)
MSNTRTALITGASAGLGRALATALAHRGWQLVLDARTAEPLAKVYNHLAPLTSVIAIPGDVSVHAHREQLTRALTAVGRLDLLVNNASTLGPSPLPPLAELDLDELSTIYRTNVIAPLGLIQLGLSLLVASHGLVINVSSDAAIESYPGWGGYGSAKSALDHVSQTLAAENPAVHFYAVDPGDMRTAMHQTAFPGQDISDRPEPESVIPGLLKLIEGRPPSGRYRVADLTPAMEFVGKEGITS